MVTPRNLPAVGAKVALGVAGSQINIKNGDIDDPINVTVREKTPTTTGRFHFPAQDKDFQLMITHPSGFAHIKSTPEWELTRIIHLEPWCQGGRDLPDRKDAGRECAAHARRRSPALVRNGCAEHLHAITSRPPGRMDGLFSSA